MDTTHIDHLLQQLDETDPADAPEIADGLAEELSVALDEEDPQSGARH